MPESTKVLGQLASVATTDKDLYSVPRFTQTTCSSLVVCNRTAGALTFRARVRKGNAAAGDEQYIYYDKSVAANDTFVSILGLTLEQNDVVTIYASNTGLSFSLFGVEIR